MGPAGFLEGLRLIGVGRSELVLTIGLVLVMAEMLGCAPALVSAVGTNHAPAELQRKRHDQKL